MNKTKYKDIIVYKKNIALELIKLGHKVFYTKPNPQKPELICWIFFLDATIEEDLQNLLQRG